LFAMLLIMAIVTTAATSPLLHPLARSSEPLTAPGSG